MSKINGYRKLTYIQSSGTQYINTTITPKGSWSIEYKYARTSSSTSTGALWCARGSTLSANTYTTLLMSGYNLRFDYNSTSSSTYSYNDTNIHTVYRNKNLVYVDNELKQTDTLNTFTAGGYFKFFATYYNGIDANIFNYAKIKCYSIKIWNASDTLINNFIPVERESDNVLGLYDLVNNAFYTNNGTGTFIKGDYVVETNVNPSGTGSVSVSGSSNNYTINAIPNSSYRLLNWTLNGYTQLEYIQSSGTQYIDTLFNADNNSSIEIIANIPPTLSNGFLYRCGTTWSTNTYALFLQPSGFTNPRYGTYTTSGQYIITDSIHVYKQDKNILYRDNAQIMALTSNTFSCGNSLILLASTSYDENISATIYSCKLWDNGTLVRDYIPVIRHIDGQVGLYDLVNHKFYGNKGTGIFIGGPVV